MQPSYKEAVRVMDLKIKVATFIVEWECNGEELRLLDCNKGYTTASRCDHRRDAGVYCSG